MRRTKSSAISIAVLMSLGACGQESSDANRATATENSQMANATAMNDPNNPFAQAEMQMNERMMGAVGADAADTWVRKMIEHHRGAVEMSNILLQQSQDENVRQMAQLTIDKQSKEIQDLEKLVRQGAVAASETANLYRPSEMQMHQRMMAAKGETIDETWMRKMIEHHRGAVAMSDVVLAQNPPPLVRAMAQRTRSDQMNEIEHLEAMLSGQNPMAAAPSAEPKTAPSGGSTSAPKAEPKAAPKAAPKETAKAAPKEELKAAPKTSPSTPTCTEEHRALGHC